MFLIYHIHLGSHVFSYYGRIYLQYLSHADVCFILVISNPSWKYPYKFTKRKICGIKGPLLLLYDSGQCRQVITLSSCFVSTHQLCRHLPLNLHSIHICPPHSHWDVRQTKWNEYLVDAVCCENSHIKNISKIEAQRTDRLHQSTSTNTEHKAESSNAILNATHGIL